MQKRLFVDMDGTMTEWRVIQSENELYREGYFRSLRPVLPVIEAVNAARKNGVDVYILSCILPDSRYALSEKISWLREHMPDIDEEHMLWVPYGKSKADFVKERFGLESLSEEDILLDDFSVNLHAWVKENGTGIKAMNGCNGSKGTWKGPRLYENAAGTDLLSAI